MSRLEVQYDKLILNTLHEIDFNAHTVKYECLIVYKLLCLFQSWTFSPVQFRVVDQLNLSFQVFLSHVDQLYHQNSVLFCFWQEKRLTNASKNISFWMKCKLSTKSMLLETMPFFGLESFPHHVTTSQWIGKPLQ